MNYPTIMPALTLDFANSRQLDPRVTFSRSSSATYLNPDTGLIALANDHEARIEKDGLLIEESRTNFIKNSTAIQLVQSNCSVALSVGPDGTNTATTATSSADGTFSVNANPNRGTVWTSPASTTWSCYLKSSQISSYRIDLVSGGGQGGITVSNITTDPVFSSIASRITNYGVQEIPGGWYRFWAVYDSTLDNATGMAMRVAAYDGVAGNSFQIGGEQCEIGSFPTSLIPTAGSTASRAADIAQVAGNNFSWYNQSEGTMQMTFNVMNNSLNNEQFLAAASSTNTGRDGYIYRVSTLYSANSGGGNNWSSIGSWLATGIAQGNNNFTFGYSRGSNATVRDGVIQKTNTETVLVEQSSATLYMMNQLSGHISRIAYYNERLTDAELQTLTS